MAFYSIVIAKPAGKQLRKLPDEVRSQVVVAIDRLVHSPRPPQVRKMQGAKNLWRIRVGDWRIIYRIEDQVCYIEIVRVGHRRDIYKY